ncbi:HAD family hydrolase [Metabacillus litoralis]|uniref:HAD family hydrolase n=1 Tax=Metabacillus litoralis TaxID=152268 RepID=UPI001CFE977D|nr:HAD-IA family hydrolase [Metabacillus litoralis]
MIKAVFFDLDGTLLDRDESVKQFIFQQYNRLSSHLGNINVEEYVNRFLQLDNHGYVWKDKVYEQLVQEYKIEGITAGELLEDYLTYFQDHCIGFNHLHELLEILKKKKYKLGIISNGFGTFQMNNIKALKIKGYFDKILISEIEGVKKPDPRIFKKGLSALNVCANESIFIGDHPENDIIAPSNLGMKTIWKKNHQFDHVQADYIIEDLMEVHEIVSNLTKRLGN